PPPRQARSEAEISAASPLGVSRFDQTSVRRIQIGASSRGGNAPVLSSRWKRRSRGSTGTGVQSDVRLATAGNDPQRCPILIKIEALNNGRRGRVAVHITPKGDSMYSIALVRQALPL